MIAFVWFLKLKYIVIYIPSFGLSTSVHFVELSICE